MEKKRKYFIHVVCNVIICVTLAVVCVFSCFEKRQNELVVVGNSEYNGTIYAGDKDKNNVSLMVNVYWGNEYLEKMLDIFKTHNVKTTFFIGGSWAKDNVELLKRVKDEGHEIASHGYLHKEHGKLSLEQNLAEIQTCHEIVKDILNIEMVLFAPPGGSYNKNTIKAATTLGYKTIMWTKDTIDWRDKNTTLIYNRATTNLSSGDLILMHPTECTQRALSPIIEEIKRRGLTPTTVSQTLGFNADSKDT